ncbi:MAG: MBOAT family protein, partial [bacterium]|nr:MBOAT family protein [bacterium]
NRRGSARTYMNLAATMLLGGLWHGASWNFVVWGGLHGFYLIAERLLRGFFAGARWVVGIPFQLIAGALTFLLVTITWVFFRAETLSDSWRLVRTMVGDLPSRVLSEQQVALVVSVTAVMLLAQLVFRSSDLERLFDRLPVFVKGPVLALPILCLFAVPGDQRAFIYFQF